MQQTCEDTSWLYFNKKINKLVLNYPSLKVHWHLLNFLCWSSIVFKLQVTYFIKYFRAKFREILMSGSQSRIRVLGSLVWVHRGQRTEEWRTWREEWVEVEFCSSLSSRQLLSPLHPTNKWGCTQTIEKFFFHSVALMKGNLGRVWCICNFSPDKLYQTVKFSFTLTH